MQPLRHKETRIPLPSLHPLVAACAVIPITSTAMAQCGWTTDPTFTGANGIVYGLHSWDPDGPGPLPPTLFAAGAFTAIGATPAARIAEWDGSSWQQVGLGIGDNWAGYFAEQDGQLFVAGAFATAGGQPANHVAAWNGLSWNNAGGGIVTGAVYGLDHYNGSLVAGVSVANYIYLFRWNGATWEQLGSRLSSSLFYATINGFHAFGPDLYVGGAFQDNEFVSIVRFDGSWHALGPTSTSWCYAVTDFGNRLIVGGSRPMPTGATHGVSVWTNVAWDSMGSIPGFVYAFAVYNGELIMGGSASAQNTDPAARLARWDGTAWRPLGAGVDGPVYALTVHNGDLIVGGGFAMAGGQPSPGLARWHCTAVPPPCYPNCDASTAAPILNVNDFICFQTRFAAGDTYANCDGSTLPPVLNVNDFICFQTSFAAGCP